MSRAARKLTFSTLSDDRTTEEDEEEHEEPVNMGDALIGQHRLSESYNTIDNISLPKRSYTVIPLVSLGLLIVLTTSTGLSAWWYKSTVAPAVVIGLYWAELVASIAMFMLLFAIRARGWPRISPTLSRLPVFSDAHYMWAAMCVVVATSHSAIIILLLQQWNITYTEFHTIFSQFSIDKLSLQVMKMHTDYLAIQSIAACLMVVYLVVLMCVFHREQYPIFSENLRRLLSSDSKQRQVAMNVALAENNDSILL